MFEEAVDALVAGDVDTLNGLLRDAPSLVRVRSARPHRATLLHYVAANGVEDERQKTPPTIALITKQLLDAGAEVDAFASMYGVCDTTLQLLVSSVHPHRAGVQVELTELLLDAGAAVDGVEVAGGARQSPLLTALAFGYPAAAEALAKRGAQVDTVVAAAGLGRLELVEKFLADPTLPASHKEQALILACRLGRGELAEVLLSAGVERSARDNQGFSGLHWAAFNGHRDVIEVLLRHGAELELTNVYGGTVLGTVVWAAVNANTGVEYAPIVERLLTAGSQVAAVSFPSGNAAIDDILRRTRAAKS